MAINTVIHTNRYSVDRVLSAGLPVMLLFADASHPIATDVDAALNEAASQHAGRLLIARIDAAEEAELTRRFHVRDLPSVALFSAGEPVALLGAPRGTLVRDWIRHLVEGAPRPAAQAQPSAAPPTGRPVELTDANFASTIAGTMPVLVDFWAAWCGPCRTIAPSVERLAQEYAGRAIVAKLNVDENPATPGRYGIRGIPTLLIFRSGQVVDQIVGAQPYGVLQQRLERQTRP